MIANVLQAITVDTPHTLTFQAYAQAAPFRTINVATRIYLDSGAIDTTVAQDIRDNLADFFAAQLSDGTANPAIDFGANIKQADGTVVSEIAWSDVFNVINDTTGVRKIYEGSDGLLLNSMRLSVSIGTREFPQLGTISIYDMDAGASL
jgi:hypothetical protein